MATSASTPGPLTPQSRLQTATAVNMEQERPTAMHRSTHPGTPSPLSPSLSRPHTPPAGALFSPPDSLPHLTSPTSPIAPSDHCLESHQTSSLSYQGPKADAAHVNKALGDVAGTGPELPPLPARGSGRCGEGVVLLGLRLRLGVVQPCAAVHPSQSSNHTLRLPSYPHPSNVKRPQPGDTRMLRPMYSPTTTPAMYLLHLLLTLVLLLRPGGHLSILLSEHAYDTCGDFVFAHDVDTEFLFMSNSNKKEGERKGGCMSR
ncbi:hypothetical protein CVT25_011565 [Psilocybe cyanescens]|uniref:Uncharacterized protein n=1 Tax=Psilocybe cyanescens TaxID=93625 RepID=A0A409X0J9_PSICY|nr:hypothetical protein CVT25_011565 [Psilocybe cyanescens]